MHKAEHVSNCSRPGCGSRNSCFTALKIQIGAHTSSFLCTWRVANATTMLECRPRAVNWWCSSGDSVHRACSGHTFVGVSASGSLHTGRTPP